MRGIVVTYRRGRVAGVAALLAVALSARVYLRDVRPAERDLDTMQVALDEVRADVRKARADEVRLGRDGVQAAIETARRETEQLGMRVPATPGPGTDPGTEVERWMLAQASRWGVDAGERAPLAPEPEGPFVRHGLCVRAVGPYHALGGFLTGTLGQRRLVKVRGLRIEAAPDTLLTAALSGDVAGSPGARLVEGQAGRGPGGQPARCGADRAGVPPGTAAFAAVAVFELAWYTRGGAAAPGERVDSIPAAPASEGALPGRDGAGT
ncbi:MAG: hypothetical protein AB1941_05015 [Gemmatimonadota bacterium]